MKDALLYIILNSNRDEHIRYKPRVTNNPTCFNNSQKNLRVKLLKSPNQILENIEIFHKKEKKKNSPFYPPV